MRPRFASVPWWAEVASIWLAALFFMGAGALMLDALTH